MASTTNDFASHDGLAHSKTAEAENLELGPRATYINSGAAAALSQEHRDYLIQRHGTLDLDPIPSADPADPYNWPTWKKLGNLSMVGFHAMMTTFTAASIIPVFANIAAELGTSIQRASYLTSLQIAILGWAPLFWKPIASRYGRRPVWLISCLGSLAFNIGCAYSPTYASMAVCRAFVAFFISPPQAIGSGVVTETFFRNERAKYMGVWTALVTLGPPVGPFLMGFVATQTGNFRWIYKVLAIINAVMFIFYLFLGPETRYLRTGVKHNKTPFQQEYLSARRIDPKPIKLYEFVQPLSLFKYPTIWVPTIAYTVVFGFASVFVTVEIPQLFVPAFGFNAQQIGLQFLGIIIGTIVGEQIGGRMSDLWMKRRAKQLGERPPPEYRLWLSYIGFVLVIIGLVVFGVQLQNAGTNYNVTPIIGIGIAGAGNQIVTTVLVTYTIDRHIEHSDSIGVYINVVRSTWGFIVPFWTPTMVVSLGDAGSGGLMAGLIFVVSLIPILLLQLRMRGKAGEKPISATEVYNNANADNVLDEKA